MCSILQPALHPSPSTLPPSSHSSSPTARPSPQEGWHESGPPTILHVNPMSTLVQSPLQPSPLLVLPSSHFSMPATIPSPHVVAQTLTLSLPAGLVHVHPDTCL